MIKDFKCEELTENFDESEVFETKVKPAIEDLVSLCCEFNIPVLVNAAWKKQKSEVKLYTSFTGVKDRFSGIHFEFIKSSLPKLIPDYCDKTISHDFISGDEREKFIAALDEMVIDLIKQEQEENNKKNIH